MVKGIANHVVQSKNSGKPTPENVKILNEYKTQISD